MDYIIHSATSSMLPQISLMEQEEFSFPMTYSMLSNLIDDNNVIFISAVSSGTILGYASLKFVDDEGFFNNIAVNRQYRGQGIADHLLKELFIVSKAKGINTISLEVRESNAAAVYLYEKNGFEITGNIKNYYTKPKENAIIMRKTFINGMNI